MNEEIPSYTCDDLFYFTAMQTFKEQALTFAQKYNVKGPHSLTITPREVHDPSLQTREGLLLECRLNMPMTIIAPIGALKFIQWMSILGDADKHYLSEILDVFKTELLSRESEALNKKLGREDIQLYSVGEIAQQKFPPAILNKTEPSLDQITKLCRKWREMEKLKENTTSNK